MPNNNTNLFLLIKSLTRSEKRNFKIFANRNSRSNKKLYLQLFDFIDKDIKYSEEKLLSKCPEIKKSQLSNIKAKLFNEILTSLRLLDKPNIIELQIRESLDFALILFNKSFYKASLSQVSKAKKSAEEIDNNLMLYSALSLERRIESQYISKSSTSKSNEINNISSKALKALQTTNLLSNFANVLHGLFIKNGYVKNDQEYKELSAFFKSSHPIIEEKDLSFYDKIYLYQSYVWYYNMTQEFSLYFKFSKRWVDLFESNSDFIVNDLLLYLNGVYNNLNALYISDKINKFDLLYDKFNNFNIKYSIYFDLNISSTYNYLLQIQTINQIFIHGKYDEGIEIIKPIIVILQDNPYNWDKNKLLVIEYKIACVYFGAENYSNTLDYLNTIINQPIEGVRIDIHCFSRILCLITHFELGNNVLLSYQIKSVYRFLSKMDDTQKVHEEIFAFLKKTSSMNENSLKLEFVVFKEKLLFLKNNRFEIRPFLYLDIIGWLDSKIQNKRIQEIIQERIENKT